MEDRIDKKTGQPVYDKQTGEIKQNKVPYQVKRKKANSTNPNTWTSYENVIKSINIFDGVGFVLSKRDPYIVIDLDDCIIDGEIQPEAKRIIKSLNSYTEISQSGNGIHIFLKGKKPGSRSNNAKRGFEMYEEKHFFIMTGNHLKGTPLKINGAKETINYLYDVYFPENGIKYRANVQLSPSMTDEEIINTASNAKNADKFMQLYRGNISSYPSQSEADLALCSIIAFYTQDPIQIERIFFTSELYRDKSNRSDYMDRTIKKAINGLTATYQKQDFQLNMNNSLNCLKKTLHNRRLEEIRKMEHEWELTGRKGRMPSVLGTLQCAKILVEYICFILFDLEENTRIAMYQPQEGIYTRNVTIIKRVISWLEPKLNSSKAEEVIYHLSNRAEVKEPTVSRYLIPVANGIYNLKTKQLEPFTSKYVFTTKISTPYFELSNNPVINGWDVESWLDSIACNDKEIKNLLWQVINDSLNGNYSRKKAIFLVGDGNNGKGTFQELITNLIGMENIATLKVNQFEERFQLGILEGKTAVIGDDVPANVYIDDSSNFNSVVTGDVVQVELKNKQPYSARFRCSVIQSTNGMPKFRNKTQGTIRRVLIVPFKADFNGTKENFKIKDEYIKDEKVLQYVLYKAINMNFERFSEPAASKQELEIFKQDNDPVLDFKYSVFDEWKIQEVPKNIVYEMYKRFCHDNGFKPLSNRQFHHQFKSYLGSNWVDGQKRFRYNELLSHVGDIDEMWRSCANEEIQR